MFGDERVTAGFPNDSDERTPPAKAAIACRRIGEADLDVAIDLLVRGFPERDKAYWQRAMVRLRDRDVPEPYPRYGYLLTDGARAVGIVLLIFSKTLDGKVFANVSSWYVEPAYRGFSTALLAFAFRLKEVTLFNISPTLSTLETIEAQGFKNYCEGTYHALAAAHPPMRGAEVRAIVPDFRAAAALLPRLASNGCHCFEVTYEGQTYPFAFLPRRFASDRLPGAQLVYCREISEFVRFAGPLGRRLMRFGIFAIMLGANGPIPGLAGRYFEGRRMQFFRGDAPPSLYDLSETELVLFGP